MSPRDPRAVVFDLDDTLYPYRRFVASGFQAVARHLARTHGCHERSVLARLLRLHRGIHRGRELQACLAELGLSPDLLDGLVALIREHSPRLSLPGQAAAALASLRRAGWRIGILTNGHPSVQARKIDALALGSAVDTVVYATACGSGRGKPDPEAFRKVAHRLNVRAPRVVVVGNDEACDLVGAAEAGMHALLCTAWTRASGPTTARRVARRLIDVPALALALVEGDRSHAV